MNYLNVKPFVSHEVVPEIQDIIQNYIDSERPNDYFESIDEVAEFSEMECPEDIYGECYNRIMSIIPDFEEDYDFSGVDETTLNEDLLKDIIYCNWDNLRDEAVQMLYDYFDRTESLDDFSTDCDY